MNRHPFPLSSRRSRRRHGYTAVEVLMAMTVMTIGATAIMSMQKASVQGNLDARKTDVANQIARTWIERLQRDAMQWTLPSPANPNVPSNLTGATAKTQYFGNITGQWLTPPYSNPSTNPETSSPGFDILGRDLPASQVNGIAGAPQAVFCTNICLSWLIPGQLIRADVRVLWGRNILSAAPANFCSTVQGDYCSGGGVGTKAPDPSVYQSIYATTAIRQNGAP